MRAPVACGLLVIFVISMFIIGFIISKLGTNVCITTFCTKKSVLISGSNDPNTNPCKNFYKFVCGNYKKLNVSHPRRISAIWEELEKQALMELVQLFESPIEQINFMFESGRKVYKGCNNFTAIDSEGTLPLLKLINKTYGFPLIEKEWDKSYYGSQFFDLSFAEYKGVLSGFHPVLFGYDILKHEDGVIASFWIPDPLTVTLPDFHKCLAFSKELYKILTGKVFPSNLEQELIDTVNLKIDVFKIKREFPRNCSKSHVIVPTDDLDPDEPAFGFGSLKDFPAQFGVEVTYPEVRIPNGYTEYINKINGAIDNVNRRVIANYMIIESIIQVIQFLPSTVRNIYDKYLRDEEDKTNILLNNRKLFCAKVVKDELETPLTASYLFNNSSLVKYHKVINSLIRRIKTNLKKLLKRTKWIDKSDKSKAYSKVNSMKFVTPLLQDTINNLTDKANFSIYYSKSCVDLNSILQGYTSLHTCHSVQNKIKIDPKNLTFYIFDEKFDIYSTKLQFDFEKNTAIVPIVYLNFPVFNEDWPKYLTYSVLGNKLTQVAWAGMGFENTDENLKDIVKDGEEEDEKIKEPSFWSETTLNNYEKEKACFLSDYDKFIKDNNIKKDIFDAGCVKQNIFETTAMKVAFLSYKQYYLERFNEEPKLSGMEKYKDEQLFFIDFGSYFCKANDKKYSENMTQAELGTPTHEFRLVNILKNFPKFSESFRCKQGSPMNPSKKCSLL